MKENLNGYRKQFKGNGSDEPTDKQKNIIKKLKAFYGDDVIPDCNTKGAAWRCINKYQEVVKFDRTKNEFYIEDVSVTNKTTYRLITEDEYICAKLIKEVKKLMTDKNIEEFEEILSYIGDYSIIKDVCECIIKQQNQ